MPSVIATRGREFYCWTQQEAVIQSGAVSPVPEPGVRRWQRRGIKHSVTVQKASGTLEVLREMVGMDNVSEALVLRIVRAAELEPLFGSRAKKAWWAGRRVLTASRHTRSPTRCTEAS